MINSCKKNLKILHDNSSHYDRALVELTQKQNDKFIINLKTGNSSITFPELEHEDVVALNKVLSLRSQLLTVAISLIHNLSEDKLKETVNALNQITER